MITLFLLLPTVALTVVLAPLLVLCLKIKSSKKDPAFVGTEGTIHVIRDKDETDGGKVLTPKQSPYVPCRTPDVLQNVSNSSNRTPSRAGERKLPDIPRDVEDMKSGSHYATLNGSDSEEELELARVPSSNNILVGKQHHPYAKVKKSKVEHPYATVKKTLGSNPAALSSDRPVSSSSSISSMSDDERAVLLRPGRASRTGSSRSGQHHHLEASSSHSVNSRQATPLPAEPVLVPGTVQNQPVQHFFSGDSQDSSKGYTSITVREPVRHIQLQASTLTQDATYATVSETSDDMYAAIEDPTYIPTGGQSQSNSDTYAVIDLPEEGQASPDGAVGGVEGTSSVYHPYSKIEKRTKKQREGPKLPPPGLGQASQPNYPPAFKLSHSTLLNTRERIEDMYAKVRKRSSLGNQYNEDNELPMGASAIMHSSLDLGDSSKLAQNVEWEKFQDSAANERSRKSEINYSDYEVSLFDRVKTPSIKKDKFPKELKSGGYDQLPESFIRWQSEQRPRLNSSNGGYETVKGADHDQEESNYEQVPDYWQTNLSGGYETVKDPTNRNNRESGYEEVKNNATTSSTSNQYSSVRRHHPIPKEVGYESLNIPKEPPYAKLTNLEGDGGSDSEMGYETIPGNMSRLQPAEGHSDYDPGYEMLSQNPEPGYETVSDKVNESTETQAISGNSSIIHMAVMQDEQGKSPPASSNQRRPSVVVIERMEVSDVDNQSGVEDVNTHIFV